MKRLDGALICVLLSFLSNIVGLPNIISKEVWNVSGGARRQLCERAVGKCKPCMNGKVVSKVTTESTITVKDGITGKVKKKVHEKVTETVTESSTNSNRPSRSVKVESIEEGPLTRRRNTYTPGFEIRK
ncbi:Uncharacterized protein PKNOH_S100036300 [Plasmodium knowlesi]|uniref:SICAvar, type I n=1 Tax=Plasmodium knowlesi TaxID=5850 RepID=A0A1Y3DSJ9_PLAKN|nr:Uncharacterized protein PKNOH_S100036300 [Plasmodium knowlesi]